MEKTKPAVKPLLIDGVTDVIDLEVMDSNTFVVIGADNDIPADLMDKLNPLLKTLKQKGFKLNYANDGRDDFSGMVFKQYALFTDVFLPFKGFNKSGLIVDDEEIEATLLEPTVKAHKIAASLKFKPPVDDEGNISYNSLNELVKKFSGRDVHLLLGSKCAMKVKFMVIYTPDDVESTADKIDHRTTGAAAFPVRMASALKIPVFNLHKADRINDLTEFINKL